MSSSSRREIRTTDALRAYVEKLLGLGEAAVQSFLRTQATASKLREVLKQAPAKFEEMAAFARRYADETPRADMKEDYAMLADIWRAKARRRGTSARRRAEPQQRSPGVFAGAEPPIGANADHAQSRPGPE